MRGFSLPALRGGIMTLAAVALLMPAPVQAQTPTQQPPTQQLPDSVQELMDEFQEKQARLQEVQIQALEESDELQEEQAELQEKVETAMTEIDPQFEERIERMEEIRAEAAEAQGAEDEEAMASLVTEAQQLQASMAQTRDQALGREDIQAEISTFQDKLLEEMVRLDPEVETVIERLEELAAQLGG